MTNRPIIFSAPMVKALIAGRKTMTRRLLKPQPVQNSAGLWVWPPNWVKSIKRYGVAMQTDEAGFVQTLMDDPARRIGYATGDRLYVREAVCFDAQWDHCPPKIFHEGDAIFYVADGLTKTRAWGDPFTPGRIRPSIHMPRWASRLTLTVTDVRVERLMELTEDDAIAEGINITDGLRASVMYASLWDELNAKRGFPWSNNPWIVALTFRVQLNSEKFPD